jgi:ATP-binding cassette subfamily B protein
MQLGFILFLTVLTSISEIISIGAMLPFLLVLTAPERLYENYLIGYLTRALEISGPAEIMLPITIGFSCAALITGILRVLLLWLQTRVGQLIVEDFSGSIYRRTLYQPYSIHVSRNSADVISGISYKTKALLNGVIYPVLNIFSSVLILFPTVVALVAVQPEISIATFSSITLIYAFISFITKETLARDSRNISRSTNQVQKALQEGLGGIREIIINGTQETYCKIYRDADSQLRSATANLQVIGGCPRYAIEAVGMVVIAAVAYSLARKSDGAELVVPILGTLAVGAQRLLPLAQQIYSSLAHIKAGRAPLLDVLDLLDQPLPPNGFISLPDPIQFQRSITLDKISFRYSYDTPLILNEISLVIPKGSMVGFIGVTGSGKSTLLDIIMGLLSPTQGSLIIDDISLNKNNVHTWRMHISHVSQAIFLSDTSIAENIAFGVPVDDIEIERVRDAATKAQIADVIESWVQQYNTVVGEQGIRLSGGQRQRIGIARALYKRSDVIVFDEATSALDGETEKSVMEAIDGLSGNLTILMISHRASTLKSCDQIVELCGGGVKRVCNYNEVFTNSKSDHPININMKL